MPFLSEANNRIASLHSHAEPSSEQKARTARLVLFGLDRGLVGFIVTSFGGAGRIPPWL